MNGQDKAATTVLTVAHLHIRDRHRALPRSGWIVTDRHARWALRWNYRKLRGAGASAWDVRTAIGCGLAAATFHAQFQEPNSTSSVGGAS